MQARQSYIWTHSWRGTSKLALCRIHVKASLLQNLLSISHLDIPVRVMTEGPGVFELSYTSVHLWIKGLEPAENILLCSRSDILYAQPTLTVLELWEWIVNPGGLHWHAQILHCLSWCASPSSIRQRLARSLTKYAMTYPDMQNSIQGPLAHAVLLLCNPAFFTLYDCSIGNTAAISAWPEWKTRNRGAEIWKFLATGGTAIAPTEVVVYKSIFVRWG